MDETLKAHLATLLGRGQRGMALGLDRVEDALRQVGDPHLAQPAIVVAGTNGKGSVCAMLEAIARAAGLRTGLTTSPHLARFAERIRIDAAPIEDAAFASALGRVLGEARDDLTFFETLTCAAFVAFAEARVDLAILEVGLGGRLDATNVVPRPLATAIVSIAEGDGGDRHLEHAALLGSTVEAIAREKAGIVKADVPLVIGPLGARARKAVLEVARERGVREVLEVVRESGASGAGRTSAFDGPETRPVRVRHIDGERIAVVLAGGARVESRPGLLGAHQVDNAAVAAATAWAAGASIAELRPAIARGLEAARWPGRLEHVSPVATGTCARSEDGRSAEAGDEEVSIWLDAAHNLDGARVLADAWSSLGPGPERTVLVFGALADKAYEAVLAVLAPLAARRIYTSPKGRAPAPLAALAACAPGETIDEPIAAIERARAVARPGDAVLVAGSIYLVGEIRAHLLAEERDPALGL